MQNLYTENCKTLLKKIKNGNKWKDILCSQIEILNIVMMTTANKQMTEQPSESLATVQGMGSLSGLWFPEETTVKCWAKVFQPGM